MAIEEICSLYDEEFDRRDEGKWKRGVGNTPLKKIWLEQGQLGKTVIRHGRKYQFEPKQHKW